MNETFDTYLRSMKRLGKLERQKLRDVLRDDNTHPDFIRAVTRLVANAAADDEDMLEDLFIFGSQVADIWPHDEIRFELSTIDRSVVAFAAGFSGRDFSTVFAENALAELQQRKLDAPPARKTGSGKIATRTDHVAHGRETKSIELQKHALAA